MADKTWTDVDIATLTPELRTAFEEYKAAYRLARDARKGFEGLVIAQAELPEGATLAFGYNFGKLSLKVVADDRKPVKAKAGTPSLASFLAAAAEAGIPA